VEVGIGVAVFVGVGVGAGIRAEQDVSQREVRKNIEKILDM
jgi:hypothetical protein